MRRLGYLLLLPLVWFPILGFLLLLGSAVPWWGWLFAVVFWVLLIRRRRLAGDAGALDVDPGGIRPSPIRGGWL